MKAGQTKHQSCKNAILQISVRARTRRTTYQQHYLTSARDNAAEMMTNSPHPILSDQSA